MKFTRKRLLVIFGIPNFYFIFERIRKKNPMFQMLQNRLNIIENHPGMELSCDIAHF